VDRFGSGKHKHAPDTVSYSRKGKLLPRMHEPSLLDRLAIMHVMSCMHDPVCVLVYSLH